MIDRDRKREREREREKNMAKSEETNITIYYNMISKVRVVRGRIADDHFPAVQINTVYINIK